MIKRISIQNFRSIERIDFNFENENIICLIGKNGSGKSNIFKAIDYFFRYINKPYSEEQIIDNSNPYIQKCIISMVFDIRLLTKKAAQNAELNDKFNKINDYISKNIEYDWITPSDIELTLTQFKDGTIKWNIEDKTICSTLKSVFPIYYIDTRHLDLYTWDILWQIISDLSATKPIDEYSSLLDETFSKIYGNKYSSSKELIEQAFNNFEISLDQYHFDSRYKNAFSMRFGGEQFMVDSHSLEYYSDGTSSFIYLKLLITLIPQISDISCKFPIMMIDEPEIGLHNDLITEFVNCLCDSIKTKAICMVSTHSPKFIVDLSNSGTDYYIYRINKKGFHSVMNKMNTSWLEQSKHKVTIRETECYFSDYLVYVEGETEIQLFSHPKILELFNKLNKVHFYSFDSNDDRLRTVHSENLNLGIPYKLIIDMDKVLQYNIKGKFNIRSEQTVNPLSNNKFNKLEQFRFYNSLQSVDKSGTRALVNKLIKNNYSLVPDKNYIDNNDYNKLMNTIISFCSMYNVIVNWSTIEGCIITYENIEDFIDFIKNKNIKHNKDHDKYCSNEDVKEKTILILSEYNGKNEILKAATYKGDSVKLDIKKTEGWIIEWIYYYFDKRIDSLNTIKDKRDKFKNDFPQLYSTLQIIENMI